MKSTARKKPTRPAPDDGVDALSSLLAEIEDKFHSDTMTAERLAEDAIAAAVESSDEEHEAQGQYLHALCLARLGRYSDAHFAYERAAELFRKQQNDERLGRLLSNRAILMCFEGEFERALDMYREALKIFERLGNRNRIAITLTNIGITLNNLHRVDEAREVLEHSIIIAEEVGEDATLVASTAELGRLAQLLGDFPRALQAYHHSLRVQERRHDLHMEADTTNVLGAIYYQLGDYSRALEYLHRAHAAAERVADHRALAYVKNNLADVYAAHGRHEEARTAAIESLSLKREMGNKRDIATSLASVARMQFELGDTDVALALCEECIEASEDAGEESSRAAALYTRGAIHNARGDRDTARSFLIEARDIRRRLGHAPSETEVLLELARLELSEECLESAREHLDCAMALARQCAMPLFDAQVHALMAELLSRHGQYELAFQTLAEGHRIEREHFNSESAARTERLMIAFDLDREQRARTIAEKESEILRLKNAELAREMDHRERELTTTAMYLTQRNHLLRNLQRRLKELRMESAANVSTTRGKGIAQLEREIEASLGGVDAWSSFEIQFHQVHPGFVETLAATFPMLTPTELKVCALIKVGLSVKQAAEVLNAEPRSIEKYRHRIRQKFGLAQTVNLASFLASHSAQQSTAASHQASSDATTTPSA